MRPTSKTWRLRIVLGMIMLALLTILIRQKTAHRQHPQFGEVQAAKMNEAVYRSAIHRWVASLVPIPRWIVCEPQFLVVGTDLLWWSGKDQKLRTGWLMFCDPRTTNAVWEFSPCRKDDLLSVDRSDFLTSFVRCQDPIGRAMYGPNWGTNAIAVREGEVVLARRAKHPSRVFVIQMGKRTGPWDASRMNIEYVAADGN